MFRAQKLTNLQHCFKVTEAGIHHSRRHLGESSLLKNLNYHTNWMPKQIGPDL